MIAQNFSYTIENDGYNQTILLVKKATNEIKKFSLVNQSIVGIKYLMDSLTDDQCESYFTKRQNHSKKK